jgi:hypothetical protein
MAQDLGASAAPDRIRTARERLALPMLLLAARREPGDVAAWRDCALAALRAGAPSFAAAVLEESTTHVESPALVGLWQEAAIRQADYESAARIARRRIEMEPDRPGPRFTLGDLASGLRVPEDPDAHYGAAFELERRRGRRHRRSFYALLLQSRYREAWSLLHPLAAIPDGWITSREPEWDGEPTSRRVCIHGFGGLGDAILWTRYARRLSGRVGGIIFAVPPAMHRLLAAAPDIAAVVSEPEHAVDALSLHALQLPAVFGDDAADVAVPAPYLGAPRDGPRLPPTRRLSVGLAWAGAPTLPTDADRSIPEPDLLRPLLGVPGVDWVSLQTGPRAGWAASLGIRPMPAVRDLADTARVVARLDLVVSVDTSIANLALAMGVPTWVFPPVYPEFRWGRTGASPWYPAARLFRRRTPDDWPRVIEAAATALRAM